ncbi:MAG: sulfatase [Rhodospirillaceae bacterium]|nr:sulfatase [Rhodospirillaceae bacterium]
MAHNILFIMSDEHQQKAAGCYGHPFVHTPAIDALAANGARFTNAYTNSPICVPARASFATGRAVNEIGNWDNAHPYDGQTKGWGHALKQHGLRSLSIGKLHYRNETDPTGFDEQILPLHVVDGIGSVSASVKQPLGPPIKTSKLAANIGPGDSGYIRYDQSITEETCAWLKNEAPKRRNKPWVLFCSLVCPHFPLIAPPDFYDMYPHELLETPKGSSLDYPLHPWIEKFRQVQCHDTFFTDETRKIAIASYYALCSFMDSNVQRIMDALNASGVRDNTLVIYTADHGENLGTRRLWGKSNMYEEASAIPLILSGPDVTAGKVVNTPVTLAEGANTILATLGVENSTKPDSQSWRQTANEPDDPARVAFSEYHATGADTAAYMIRKGAHKYIHYVGYGSELFDLNTDPEEQTNLANDPEHAATLVKLQAELTHRIDPDEVNAAAQKSQAALVNLHGGRRKVLDLGSFQGTPAPGEKAEYVQ